MLLIVSFAQMASPGLKGGELTLDSLPLASVSGPFSSLPWKAEFMHVSRLSALTLLSLLFYCPQLTLDWFPLVLTTPSVPTVFLARLSGKLAALQPANCLFPPHTFELPRAMTLKPPVSS